MAFIYQKVYQLLKMGIIAGAQGAKRNFFITGIVKHFDGIVLEHCNIPLPDRFIQLSRLAETASADTSSLNFKHNPVLCAFNKWHNGLFGIICIRNILDKFFYDCPRNIRSCWQKRLNRTVFVVRHLIKPRYIH